MGDKETVDIPIPKEIVSKIEEKIKDTSFGSVASYVTYVLRKVVAQQPEISKEDYSKDEEEKVKKKLKGAGYL